MDKSINIGQKIRQILVVLLGMVVIFTTIPFYAFAETGETALNPTISVNEVSGSQGSYVYFYVEADDMAGIASMEYTLHYDPDVLEFNWASQGYLLDGLMVDINSSTPGEIKTSFMSLDGIEGNGTLLSAGLYIKDDAEVGTYPITITVGETYDTGFKSVNIKKISGQVTVTKSSYSPSYIEFYTQCDNSLVKYGDTFTYTLYSWYGESITGGNFEFFYDRDLLEVVDVTLGDSLCSETAISSINKKVDGYVKVTFGDTEPISMDYGQEFVNITFKARENVTKNTEITFTADSLVNVISVFLVTFSLTLKVMFTNSCP